MCDGLFLASTVLAFFFLLLLLDIFVLAFSVLDDDMT